MVPVVRFGARLAGKAAPSLHHGCLAAGTREGIVTALAVLFGKLVSRVVAIGYGHFQRVPFLTIQFLKFIFLFLGSVVATSDTDT